jgi:hypothetical protein
MYLRPMPTIQAENISGEAKTYAENIITTKGQNKGRLRASKVSTWDNETYYVWRMACFFASPKGEHSCMPVGAMWSSFYYNEQPEHDKEQGCKVLYNFRDEGCSCDIKERKKEYNNKEENRRKELDKVVDLILSAIPVSEWYGVRRWNKAFTGNDPFDDGSILGNVSVALTKKEEMEGILA